MQNVYKHDIMIIIERMNFIDLTLNYIIAVDLK